MGKILVLAEKPSVGRELARVLGAKQGRDGYIAGGRYIVTWSLGHLVTLADPEHYSDQYKKWSLETLPMLPKKMDLVVIKDTARQFKVVNELLHSAEVDELVIATDAGREGELVARWIIEKAGFKKPVKRLWISSQTDKSIREGFDNLKSAKAYENLYQSAQCRAYADWLVGLNVTRALTCKFNAQLSAGRVQTPTLALIVQRERDIKAFVPQDYFYIKADFGGWQARWCDKTGKNRLSEEVKAEKIAAMCRGQKGKIVEWKREKKTELPPLLYDLTELQRDANIKFGYTAKETLQYMQKLYEIHKILTYPRTDSRYLSSDIVPSLVQRLKVIPNGEFSPHIRDIMKRGITATKRFVDDSKVTDHHAIIPTEEPVRLTELTFDERRIYDLVVRRFLAALSASCQYEQVTLKAQVGMEFFTAKGKSIISPGWKTLYGLGEEEEDGEDRNEKEEKDQNFSGLSQGTAVTVTDIKVHKGKTKPPARYTEATLLSAMEHPGKFVEDSKLRAVLEGKGGIGTPATRADIIEKLFTSNYAERRGKEIFPLSKGMQLIDLVPQELRSPELTGKWEERLLMISEGKERSGPFLTEMRDFAGRLVTEVKGSHAEYRHDNVTRTRCPLCGQFLLEINGKKGKLLVCPDRECGHKQNVSFTSNARCPQCHKKLEVVGEGDKRLYLCKCGFREKFDRFNAELKARADYSGKRDVADYIKKQKKDEEEVSVFALAWANAKENDKK